MRALLHHPASGIFQILLLAGRLLVCSHVQHTMRQLYILRRNLLQCVIVTIMYSTTTYLHSHARNLVDILRNFVLSILH